MRIVALCVAVAVLSVPSVRAACPVVFPLPSDDRWQYPFNFQPGTRASASCFGSTADPDFDTFNDRDGIFLIAWRTDAEIETGLPLDAYEILAVRVTLTAAAGPGGVGRLPPADWFVDLTVDPWFNMDYPLSDADNGSPLELFGVGFGPFFTASTWNETGFYVGGDDQSYEARDPFPFVYSGVGMAHVEDSVKDQFTPQPWAIGLPAGYNRPSTVPFPVHFDIDLSLSNESVLRYFQEQVRAGKVFVAITSLYATVKQAPSGFPSFFTKESPDAGAVAPILVVTLASTGDANRDGRVGRTDHANLAGCLGGPGSAPGLHDVPGADECLCAFDFDDDADVDLWDVAVFQERFDGGL